MPALEGEEGVLAGAGEGVLGEADGGDGLEGDAEVDVLAVGDAALDAAGAVGGSAYLPVAQDERVIVRAAAHGGGGKAGAVFEAFGGVDAHHGVGEARLEAVEDGFAEPGGQAGDDAGDGTADGVTFLLQFAKKAFHALREVGVGAADGVGLREVERKPGVREGEGKVADAGGVGADGDALRGEDLPGDGAGDNAGDVLAGGGTSATSGVADAILGFPGVVGVGRAVEVAQGEVVLGARVAVADEEGDGHAGGTPFEKPGEDLEAVFLGAGGGDVGLPGAAAVELMLYLLDGQDNARGAAFDDAADSRPVGFPERGQAIYVPESVGHAHRGLMASAATAAVIVGTASPATTAVGGAAAASAAFVGMEGFEFFIGGIADGDDFPLEIEVLAGEGMVEVDAYLVGGNGFDFPLEAASDAVHHGECIPDDHFRGLDVLEDVARKIDDEVFVHGAIGVGCRYLEVETVSFVFLQEVHFEVFEGLSLPADEFEGTVGARGFERGTVFFRTQFVGDGNVFIFCNHIRLFFSVRTQIWEFYPEIP